MKKKYISIAVTVLIFLAGFAVLFYPEISNYVNERHMSRVVAGYNDAVSTLPETDYSADLEAAMEYNAYIARFRDLSSAMAAEEERDDSPYEKLLDADGSGIMAVIKIPVVGIDLPIYHGTDEAVLQVAAGHYRGSSLPVGGRSTHAVITGHRGLLTAKLFTDLDRLQLGDVFYIRVLGDVLEYQIDRIQVVLPEETQSLGVTEGEDQVTLVTCTPYGVNSHRMLITGSRIPYDGKDEEPAQERPVNLALDESRTEEQGFRLTTVQWSVIAVMVIAAAQLIGFLMPVRKGEEKNEKGE